MRFLAVCLLLLLASCGDKAKNLYDTAQLEEKQNNRLTAHLRSWRILAPAREGSLDS
jgi:hypothetical protein